MSKLYKLTDGNGQTRNGMQWGPGVTNTASGAGISLCTGGVIHAYEHPAIAVLMAPGHVEYSTLRLWESEGDIVVRDGHSKCGAKSLTTMREIPLPVLTVGQLVLIAIACALEVYDDPTFTAWARAWVSEENRSANAANAAANVANAAAYAANAAANAAYAANAAAYAANAAANAANAAANAAYAAANAAYAANAGVDLIAIVERVVGSTSAKGQALYE